MDKKVLMILGCQRSGTTLFSSLFDEVFYAQVFEEKSPFSQQDRFGFRLDPVQQVTAKLKQLPAPLIVLKPLVESQNALYWLDSIPNSKAVWLYRDYRDTAASNLKKFGLAEGSINNIRPFVDPEFAKNDWATWNAENASDATTALIKKYYSPGMRPEDAAVLFWYSRNILFFEQQLLKHPSVILLKYEEFVKQPDLFMTHIFDKLEVKPYKPSTLTRVDTSSINKGHHLMVSPDIASLADDLQNRLDKVFYASGPSLDRSI